MELKLPEICLGEISLREICEADFLDYYEIGKDEEITKYLNWGPFKYSYEALYAIKEIFMKRPVNDGVPKGYAIVFQDKMIGMIDFHTYDKQTNSCEIGYVLNKNYWNMGIMKKCVRKIIDIGFNYLQLDKIIVGHTIYNEASKKVIIASGFKYERIKVVESKDEKMEFARYYSMSRYEYEGGNENDN